MFGLVDVLFYRLLLLACLVLLLSVKKSCESKVGISYFLFACLYLCVCVCMCALCVLPGVVAIKIQFNSMRSKQTYKQHQVTHIELNEHTNNTR